MLYLHYSARLPPDMTEADAEARAAAKAPAFDGLPGLAWKAFLFRAGRYGALYLWDDPAAAGSFLAGPLYAAVVERFGPPDMRAWAGAERFPLHPDAEWIGIDRSGSGVGGAARLRTGRGRRPGGAWRVLALSGVRGAAPLAA
jgi:hypothetical protein